jgi:NAD(P)-dependent dehydrogenase (short-subunit alcohol dehydrogenase family)
VVDKLKDKVAIVTGAGSGIGRSSAKLFANEGARVVVADIAKQLGKETVEIIQAEGGEANFIESDVSKPDSVENLIRVTVETYHSIDVLFNNAGINLEKTVTETSEQEFNRVIDINLKGVFFCSKFAIPEMISRGGGAIINTASIRGLVPQFHLAAYCASKGAVVLLTKAMALDYGPKKIRVNCICPGPIQTPMHDAFFATLKEPEKELREILKNVPLSRMGRPEDIAHTALFLASDDSSFITGATIVVDGGRILHV